MLRDIGGVDAFAMWANTVEMLVNVGDAVLPQLGLPFWRRQFIFQRRGLTGATTADAVKRCGLTGLLVEIHLSQKTFDAGVNWRPRILINIHATVLIQVNPTLVVNWVLTLRWLSGKGGDGWRGE